MKFCKECGKELEDELVFCSRCGIRCEESPAAEEESERTKIFGGESEKHSAACQKCGALMQEGEIFCGECGTKIEEEAVRREQSDPVIPDETPVLHDETPAFQDETPAFQDETPAFSDETPAFPDETPALSEEIVFCPECGTKNNFAAVFCENCGFKLHESEAPAAADTIESTPIEATEELPEPETIFCPECGTKNDPDSAFCLNCGFSFKQVKEKNGKKSKIGIAAAVAAVAVIGLGAAFLPKLLGGGSNGNAGANSLIYFKEGSTIQYNIKSGKNMELTDRTIDGSGSDLYYRYSEALSVDYTSDGKHVLYYEQFDDGDWSGDLYIRSAKNNKEDEEKIDSGVSYFNVTDKDHVFYLKDSSLYQYNIKKEEKEKLASDVNNWRINEAETTIVWYTSDMVLYKKELKKDSEKEKLDSDLTSMVYANDDLSSIFYEKEDVVYTIKNLQEKEKVASEAQIVALYKKNGIYYTKAAKNDIEFAYADFIEDDMAAGDQSMREPQKSDFSKMEQTWAGMRTVTDYDAYNAAGKEYDKKLNRDRLRERMKESVWGERSMSDLYTYDGEESQQIASTVEGAVSSGFASFEDMEPAKVAKLSQINSVEEIFDNHDITDLFENEFSFCVLGRDAYSSIALDRDSYVDSDYKNNIIYEITTNDKDYEELYKYDISGGEVQEEKLDADMTGADSFLIKSGEDKGIYYFKDTNDDGIRGTLYKDGKKIMDDAYPSADAFSFKDGSIFVLTDYNQKNSSGTLKMVSGDKSEKIADDVYSYQTFNGGTVAYIYEFSQKRGKGDLYMWKGKKTEKIDEDVSFISGGNSIR